MAKIHILKKIIEGVKTAFYPLTIPQAVIDPTSGKSARAELDEKANHGYESNPKTLKSVDDAKADHGYDVEETPKTLKEVDDEVIQLAGEVSVKMENLIVNGDFRDGTTGWDILGAPVITITDNIATINPNIGGAGISSNTNFKINNTYYFRVGVKGTMNFRLRVGAAGTVEYQTEYITYPDWSTFTYQRKMVNNDVDFFLLGNTDIQYQLQKVQAINLTEIFGVGNEPTKEEFELLLSIMGSQYFEGEITIPAQKVMQWQLAMIRQNRNAIIALGGTII